MIKKKQASTEKSPEELSPILEHMLVNGHDNSSNQQALQEHTLLKTHEHAQNAESIAENQLVKLDDIDKNIKQLSTKLDPKEVGDGSTFIVKGVKGDAGKDAPIPKRGVDYYTPEDISHIIDEVTKRIPKPLDGKDGLSPIINYPKLISDILSEIPKPKNGKDGIDGKDVVVDYAKIAKMVIKMIPKQDIQQYELTYDELNSMLKGRFSYNDLKDIPTSFPRLAGTGYLREISDVNTDGLKDGMSIRWNATTGKWIVFTPGTGSGGSTGSLVEIPNGTVDGSNKTFVFTNNLPQLLCINGLLYRQNGGAITWTVSGMSITLSSPVGISGSIFGISGSLTLFEISGTINGSNVTFTTTTQPKYLNGNGIVSSFLFPWSYSLGNIALTNPVGNNGSIFGITGITFQFNPVGLVIGII